MFHETPMHEGSRSPRLGVEMALEVVRGPLEDGRVLDVVNVIWCTGFHPGFSWIDLPVLGKDGEPNHDRGIVANELGLYFVGLHFSTRSPRRWFTVWGETRSALPT
jgi:hypothetical protein